MWITQDEGYNLKTFNLNRFEAANIAPDEEFKKLGK
jgi:hypothetical protein